MKKKDRGGRKSPFTVEQKAEALAMIERGDLTAGQVAASLGVTTRCLRRWRDQLEADEDAKPLSAAERQKLRRLERKVKDLELQLALQKKLRALSRRRQP